MENKPVYLIENLKRISKLQAMPNGIIHDKLYVTNVEAQWILDNLKPEPQEDPEASISNAGRTTIDLGILEDRVHQRKRDIAQMAAVLYAEYDKNNDPSNAPIIMDLAIFDATELYGRVMA